MKSSGNEIWLVVDSSGFGGIESHIFQLALALKDTANVNVVFIKNYGPHPLTEKLSENGIQFQFCTGGFLGFLKRVYSSSPSVLHSHGYKAGVYCRVAAKLSNTRCVSTFHAGEKVSGKLALYDWLDRSSAFLTDKALAVSQEISSRIPSKNIVMDNFVNRDEYSRSAGQEIAFVGRLSFEKGPDIFLNLAAQFPQRAFHIYGNGPMLEELKQCATPNVVFHGQQSDMTSVWKRIGLLVISSRQEGMPMTALEALSHGIPIVSSNVGAISKLVGNNQNGWLCPVGNVTSFTKCVDAWRKLGVEERRLISDSAIKTIRSRFSAKVIAPLYMDIYGLKRKNEEMRHEAI